MIPLITHMIGVSVCFQRQQANYHKCHRCLYRGQAADYEVPAPARLTPQPKLTAAQRNGALGSPEPVVAREDVVESQPESAAKTKKPGKAKTGSPAKAKATGKTRS